MIAALVGAPLGDAAQAAVLAYSSFLNLPDEKEAGALEHKLIVRRRLPPPACSQLFQVCIFGVQLASRHSWPCHPAAHRNAAMPPLASLAHAGAAQVLQDLAGDAGNTTGGSKREYSTMRA